MEVEQLFDFAHFQVSHRYVAFLLESDHVMLIHIEQIEHMCINRPRHITSHCIASFTYINKLRSVQSSTDEATTRKNKH